MASQYNIIFYLTCDFSLIIHSNVKTNFIKTDTIPLESQFFLVVVWAHSALNEAVIRVSQFNLNVWIDIELAHSHMCRILIENEILVIWKRKLREWN